MRDRTYTEQLQRLAAEYLESCGGEATAREIAVWAIELGRWVPQRSHLVDRLAEQVSRAMREEYIVDAQGRSVRAKCISSSKTPPPRPIKSPKMGPPAAA